MSDKTAVRAAARVARAGLTAQDIAEKSKRIAERVVALDEWKAAQTVALYAAFDSEVRTELLARAAWEDEKAIGYPRVDQHGGKLIFHRVQSSDELRPGIWGIPEPSPDADLIEPPTVDLWIVPGLAFDDGRHRVGYGKGYYDGVLSSAREDALKVGVAFETQIVPEVPVGPHDVSMDYVVTENRLI